MYSILLQLAFITLAASQASIRQALEEDACNSARDGNALLQRTTSAKMQGASQDPEFKALVINLDTRQDRWDHMTEELKPLDESGFLEYERLPAVNGSTIEASEIESTFAPEHIYEPVIQEFVHDWYGLPLPMPVASMIMQWAERAPTWSDGERGCAMSHIHAWRKIAAGTEPMLVFEDDSVLEPDFEQTLVQSQKILDAEYGDKADILFLQYNTFAKMMNLTTENSDTGVSFKGKVADLGSDRSLMRSDFVMDSGSYLLWPSGAQKLLGAVPLNYTAGFIISLLVHRGEMEGFAINPPLVNQLWMVNMSDPTAMNDIEKLTE